MQQKIKIDINADLGEGAGNDAQIMPLISSCSIACGGHAGDRATILEALTLAKKHGVKVGAHPSFPDRDSFGRTQMTMTKDALKQAVFNQMMLFNSCCEALDMKMHHVKLHGALYNYAAKDAATSDAVVEAILQTGMRPLLYVPPNSVLGEKAKNIVPTRYEGFIDRVYHADLSLVSRNEIGAVIYSKESALQQLVAMVVHNTVTAVNGTNVSIHADTFCIHGDQKNAVEILHYIRKELSKNGISIL